MAENNTKHPTKHNALIKTGIVGVVAGLLGGGVAYAGLSQVHLQVVIRLVFLALIVLVLQRKTLNLTWKLIVKAQVLFT